MSFFSRFNKVQKIILKSLMWTVISILILVILLVTWLAIFFPSQYVKGMIEKEGSKALGRVVKIEDLDVSLFSGIKIKNFTIFDVKNKTGAIKLKGGQIFIKAGAVDLSYRVLPILWKKLEIKKAVIVKPQIHVVKYRGGSFNFSDIINKLTAPAKKEDMPPLPKNQSAMYKIKKILRRIFRARVISTPFLAAAAKTADKKAVKKEESDPMDFDIKKVGFENAVITLTDYSNPVTPAIFTIDRFNFIVSDINSSNYKKPAKIRLTFQVSLKRIQGRRVMNKAFNIFFDINGVVYLFRKDGKMMSSPAVYLRVDLKDGLLEGFELQRILNRVMEGLKAKFFNEFAKNLVNFTGNFDKIAKQRMNEYLNKYKGKLNDLTAGILKSKSKTTGEMKKDKKSSMDKYKAKAKSFANKVDKANRDFIKKAEGIYKVVKLVNPGEAKKFKKKLDSYKRTVGSQTAKIKARANSNGSSQGSAYDRIIAKVQKKYDDAVKQINKTYDKIIKKYVKNIQKKVHAMLKKYVKKARDFKLNLPFLNKVMKFKYGNLHFAYVNGVVTIRKLNIGAPDFKLKAEKTVYNTNNNDINARTDLYADKKYNKNIITNFFNKPGEDVHIKVKTTGKITSPSVELIGIDLKKRLKEYAVKYAKILAKKFLGKNLPIDRIFGSGSGSGSGGGDYKTQFKAVAKKYAMKLLQDEQLQKRLIGKSLGDLTKYKNKAKNKVKKKAKKKIKNLKKRFGF